jgi:hypothetical protein
MKLYGKTWKSVYLDQIRSGDPQNPHQTHPDLLQIDKMIADMGFKERGMEWFGKTFDKAKILLTPMLTMKPEVLIAAQAHATAGGSSLKDKKIVKNGLFKAGGNRTGVGGGMLDMLGSVGLGGNSGVNIVQSSVPLNRREELCLKNAKESAKFITAYELQNLISDLPSNQF